MDLQKIKNSLNLRAEEVFSSLGMQYEVLGDNIYCNCPAHEASDNPRAFSFSKDKGIWKCWTRDCQYHYKNDIFGVIRGFLSKQHGEDVGFSEALKWSCSFLGVSKSQNIISKSVKTEECDFSRIVNTINSNTKIETQYSAITLECNSIPSYYFLNRGFKKETLSFFEVGDCTDKSSKLYDRSIIPIHNEDGTQIIGSIARAIKEYKSPKFLITPKGFDKRYIFYNYHRAIDYVYASSSLILVEGQSDIWRLHEAGIKNVMSIFGRTLSKEQEYKLSTMPLTKVVILMDNDQAGREAKVQLQRQLNRMYKLFFPRIPTKDVGEMTVDQIHKILVPQLRGNNG